MPFRPPIHQPRHAPRPQHSDALRRQVKATRSLYSSARWLKLRAAQLAAEPTCRMCWDLDRRAVAATVCDHVEPHRDDVQRFWSGPFQSLCQRCHSGRKQRHEAGGDSNP